MKKVLEVIIERCLGCHTCELECALAHSDSETFVQAVQSKERLFPRIILQVDGDKTIPIHCRHCTDAPCIIVCPTSAMSRISPDDPVVLNKNSCIGCNGCVLVCPFGVIQMVPKDNYLTKCDLCVEKLREGETPACAASCPTKAILYRDMEDLNAERRAEAYSKFKVSMRQREELKE